MDVRGTDADRIREDILHEPEELSAGDIPVDGSFEIRLLLLHDRFSRRGSAAPRLILLEGQLAPVFGPVALFHVTDFEFLVRQSSCDVRYLPVRRIRRDDNDLVGLVFRKVVWEDLVSHRQLPYRFRQAAEDLQHVGRKKTPCAALVDVDHPEGVELRDLVVKDILGEPKFLLQDLDQAPLVPIIGLLPLGRLHRNFFGDDPVADKVLEERSHERPWGTSLCLRRECRARPALIVVLLPGLRRSSEFGHFRCFPWLKCE